jgi:hypothetical protein
MALEKGIHIHIHLPREGIPVVSKTSEKPPSRDYDGLILRLSNKDALNEQQSMELMADVINYVKTKIKKGDKSNLKAFLTEAKDKLAPEMRSLISEELKLAKL